MNAVRNRWNNLSGRIRLALAAPLGLALVLIVVVAYAETFSSSTVNGTLLVTGNTVLGASAPSPAWNGIDLYGGARTLRIINPVNGAYCVMGSNGLSINRPGQTQINNLYVGAETAFRVSKVSGIDTASLTLQSDGDVIVNSGKLGIGTTTPGAALHVVGTTKTSVIEVMGNDLAERFDVRPVGDVAPMPGMVTVIDETTAGGLALCSQAYDRRVAGIISGAGGLKPGVELSQEDPGAKGRFLVALNGRVYCMADASFGAIQPGDLLTASTTVGHAMKVTDHDKAQGAVIGKAMTGLDSGTGLVLVLVSLQ